jgi:hypothetical protein
VTGFATRAVSVAAVAVAAAVAGASLAGAQQVALPSVRLPDDQPRPLLDCAQPGGRIATLVSGHKAKSEVLVSQIFGTAGNRLCTAPLGTGSLPTDSVINGSVVIFLGPGIDGITTPGANAAVAATVHGDVIVFGGDLFLEPGAVIEGRAVSIGGGVYPSALASVHGHVLSERGARTAWHGSDTVAVTYWPAPSSKPPLVSLPLLAGFRIPSYDRVNGLSIPWGPRLNIDSSRLVFDPIVTYRSNLGKFDPKGTVVWTPVPRFDVIGTAERGTFTNDDTWRPSLMNSLSSLIAGSDYRNYWRADRFQLEVQRLWGDETAGLALQPWVGVRDEFDWSTGPDDPKHVPWSLLDRGVADKMRRYNPPIDVGRLSSALGGLFATYHGQNVSATGSAQVEVPFESPNGQHFTQTTVDGLLRFISFTDWQFQFGVHGVLTVGDTAPPQRFTYLGGGATIPTLDILQLGGDEMLWTYGEFLAPVKVVKIPFLGYPALGIFATTGSAGVHGLPHFTANVGPRIALNVFELDWVIDPVTKFTEVGLAVNLPY